MKADINLELFLGEDTQVLAKHIALLKAIKETKSITKAAEVVGISYKNAWDCLDTINNKSSKPLIIRADGNKKNSGSELSPYAKFTTLSSRRKRTFCKKFVKRLILRMLIS